MFSFIRRINFEFNSKGDRATGFGVALLNSLFGDSNSNPAFKQIGPQAELPLKNTEAQNED